jgi:hypothetical protein
MENENWRKSGWAEGGAQMKAKENNKQPNQPRASINL